jgi:hypothetical protein
MSYNGSGTFVINSTGQPVVTGTVISSTAFNALTADLATGLSTALTKDGQTTPTANLPMGTFKFTGMGNGSAATDSATISQVQNSFGSFLTVAGTDTITASVSPALTAYASGQMFAFVAANTNTGAVTINISSLGAKSITKNGTTALVAGDLTANYLFVVVYDGTQFQVVGVSATTFTNLTISGVLTLSGAGVQLSSSGTGAWKMPVGTTAQRPTGAAGLIRLNSTTGEPEWYDSVNSVWLPFRSGPTYSATYLVVAGGGGAGASYAGGGGAGGLLSSTATLTPGTSYTITIGSGGAGNATGSTAGASGTNSVLTGIATSIGGGGGAAAGTYNAASGGSGGGGSGAIATAGSGTSGQGNTGGVGTSSPFYGGGGGGASAVGAAASGIGGAGGAGTASSITGTSLSYAGGGGGGTFGTGNGGNGGAGGGGGGAGATPGTGGSNGGVSGTSTAGGNGGPNTGGGGGGGYTGTGGNGGSGVVIISVPTTRYSGVYTGSPSVTTSGANTILQFNASGSYTA